MHTPSVCIIFVVRSNLLVEFHLDAGRYALPLEAVKRVVAVAEFTPLPHAPAIVLGVINVAGEIIPVLDIRKRFRLPPRTIDPRDQMIIADTRTRRVAIVVESVGGVIDLPENAITAADNVLPRLDYVAGVAKLPDGLMLIHCLDTFLSLDEEAALVESLTEIQA